MKPLLRHVLLLLLAAAPLRAQASGDITVAWCYSDDGQAVGKTPRTFWTSGDEVLLLDETKPPSERVLERVAAATGARKPAVDRAASLASLGTVLDAAEVPETLPWPDSFDRAGRLAVYVLSGDVFALDLATSRFERVTNDRGEGVGGAAVAGRAQGRLRARRRSLRLRLRVEDGIEADLRRQRLRLERRALVGLLGGDLRPRGGRLLVVGRLARRSRFCAPTKRASTTVTFPKFSPAVPEILTQRYPKAGDANPSVRLGIVGRRQRQDVLDEPGDALRVHPRRDAGCPTAAPSPSRRPTGRRRASTSGASSATAAATRLLLTDTDEAWVNQKELQFLDGGK